MSEQEKEPPVTGLKEQDMKRNSQDAKTNTIQDCSLKNTSINQYVTIKQADARFHRNLVEFLVHLTNIDQPKWEVVSKFLYGLCNPTVNNKIEAKKQVFHEKLTGLKTLLQICDWIHKANDPELNSAIKFQLPSVIWFRSTQPICSTDLSCLMYVLRETKPLKPLEDGCNIHLLEKLSFYQTNIGDDGIRMIAEGLHHIKVLDLRSCNNITSLSMRYLGDKLGELQTPMKILVLSGIQQLRDEGARAIASGLHNVEELNLDDCGITALGATCIGKALKTLKHPMKNLDLSGNKQLLDEGAQAIASGLHNVEKLNLDECGITDVGATCIGKALKTLKHPMKILVLSYNQLQDEGAQAIASGLPNVEELYLHGCGITALGATCIGKALKTLKHPMKILALSYNELQDEGAQAIASGLPNVEELNLGDCGITAVGATCIGKALKTLKHPMKVLVLFQNPQLQDEGARAIASGLPNVEELYLHDCGITDVGATCIGKALKTLKHPMKILDLNFNEQLRDEGAQAIASGLRNVEELYLGDCGITDVGATFIGNALKTLEHPKPKIYGLGLSMSD